jgi:hypothetical protein
VIYFDSTYIIKCYVAEPGTKQVLALAQSQGFAGIYSYDRHLLAAAIHFGLTAKNVIS